MFRALLELVVTIILVIAARAILASFMKGVSAATSNAFRQQAQNAGNARASGGQPGPASGSNLHKDPVCGTYVVESTPFRRQAGSTAFYFCSEECLRKHKA